MFGIPPRNAEICDAMKPKEGDVLVEGKKGLDAFPGTDLEAKLKERCQRSESSEMRKARP